MTRVNEVLRTARERVLRLPGAIGYLVVGGVTSVLALFAVIGLLVVGAFCLIGVGIPALPEAMRLVRPLVSFERRRAARRLGEPIIEAYQPIAGGLRQRVTTVFADPANRRDVGWLVAHALTGIYAAAFAVALPLSMILQLVTPAIWQHVPPGELTSFGFEVDSWPRAVLSFVIAFPLGFLILQLPVVAHWQALLARALLGPAEGIVLADRVAALTATRAAALDAHGAELRRIERDLHDGAQARIAAVIMQLGLADQLREQDPEAAQGLVRKAQDTATAALAELRDVVRNVYPPVLSDRGLASAISALAARSPIPCVLESSEVGRRPAAVEAAAYFVITEALTNATKHSGAEHLSVTMGGPPELLRIEIRDDGAGSAVETYGGGLAGIRRRAEALDGRMVLTSPPGGPTVLRVELPCGS
ncbi:signal transduction histidine kinase [Nocardia tenerifensis]|uniref:histidine kinase n=1 Tax=Nocardia tenerifensis TaxID=228006 RepID=A0A318K4B5_9NOCA|nr:sensor histidine kinase [Nocardia tenerifensis]PXX63334.1 signal transduction histidine kinase [Nocardia tenerifensis]